MFIVGFITGGLVGICYMVLMKISTILDLQEELDQEKINNLKLENIILQLRNEIHGIEVEPIEADLQEELEEELLEREIFNLDEYLKEEGVK